MTIIEKKLQAIENLRKLDEGLQFKLATILNACSIVKDEITLDGSKSEIALKKQYIKIIDNAMKKLTIYVSEVND